MISPRTTTMTMAQSVVHHGLPADTFAGTVRVLVKEWLNEISTLRSLPSGMGDDIQLVITELINNACEATPEDQISFCGSYEPEQGSIWVGVWDSSPEHPEPKPLDPILDITPDARALDEGYEFQGIGGRGLNLVMAMAAERNVRLTDNPRGKWVWARFRP
jgi:anti-sigma regulatory factor (Ser/Thr protein kinase)